MKRKANLVYVHGHGIHPNRRILFPAIGCQFIPADPYIRWLHLSNPPRWRKFSSLLVSSIFFPQKSKWDIFIGDGPKHLPVVMKKLRQLKPEQKIIPYLAGEFSYFLANDFYGKKTGILRNLFLDWDAYLCSGKLTQELVKKVLPEERHADIFVIKNCVRNERVNELKDLRPNLESYNMIFVGNGPEGFRVLYKGLDLMFEAYVRAKKYIPQLKWTIVGDWSEKVKKEFSTKYKVDGVTWINRVDSLKDIFRDHSLYIHCARGDAYPNTVMEAMVAGLPVLNSEHTGTKEILENVDRELITKLDPDDIAQKILWYFSLSKEQKKRLGEESRNLVLRSYREEHAIKDLREKMCQILEHLKMSHLEISPEIDSEINKKMKAVPD